MSGISRLLPVVVAGLLAISAARGETPVPVRTGSHPTFGRIVFDAGTEARYTFSRDGGQVTIRFEDDVALAEPQRAPRNVSRLTAEGATARFTIPANARIRAYRLGDRVVVDVFDPTNPDQAGETNPTGVAPRSPPNVQERVALKPPAKGEGRVAAQAKPAVSSAEPPAALAANVSSPGATTIQAAAVPASAPLGGLPNTPRDAAAQAVQMAAATVTDPPLVDPLTKRNADPPTDRIAAAQNRATPEPRVERTAVVGPLALTRSTTAEPSAPPPAPREPVKSDPPAAAPPARASVLIPTAQPTSTMARRLATLPDTPTVALPFPETVSAAMFQRESTIVIVFAERRPIDLSALRDDFVFSTLAARPLTNATLLTMPVPEGRSVSLTPTPQGWRLAVIQASRAAPPLRPGFLEGKVTLPTANAAAVVPVTDPDSGATLLVGTVTGQGDAVTMERRTPEFILAPTLRGVVVEPFSDRLDLRVTPPGFVLSGHPFGLSFSPPEALTGAMLSAARLTRRFQFPAMATENLSDRVRAQIARAASMPTLGRNPARKAAAETMVALGMAAEAEALLNVITAQDPKEVTAPNTLALKAIAAVLNGRLNEAQILGDTRFGTTDEDALWRGLWLAARNEDSPEAAQLLAATAPLLLTYPPTLRDRTLPRALENLAQSGQARAAEGILNERTDDPALDLARAFVARVRGDADTALTLFDNLANGRDRLVRARAATQAVELRLAVGRLTQAEAADALDRLLYVWRGDGRDLALRRRIAELRSASGAWRAAFAMLRETAAEFPAQAEAIQNWRAAMFATFADSDAVDRLDPLELVTLAEENTDLLPAGEKGDRLRANLADRLIGLELAGRADSVLERLMRHAPTDQARAIFGTKLAELRLRRNDPQTALAALGESAWPDMPDAQKAERRALTAAALARSGNAKGALNALSGLDTDRARELRAEIHEQLGDWPAAKTALASLSRRIVPAEGALEDPQRRVLLRLASAAARAGDNATLAELRAKEAARMGAGPMGEMFRLLTAEPLSTTADLSRGGRELDLVKSLPAGLQAVARP
jgi:hypothetical protein